MKSKSKKTKRRYSKRENAGYQNYVKMYKQMEKKMRRHGLEPVSPMYNKASYVDARLSLKDEGVKYNINQTLVSEQQYKYSDTWAKNFKKYAKEMGKEYTYRELRSASVDISEMNKLLKDVHPDWTGYDREAWITENIYGGSE